MTWRDTTSGWPAGLRDGVGLALGSFALAVTFGAFAVRHGWPVWLTVTMSALTFSGSAQFALVTAMAGGGGLGSGLGSAALINLRFVPMAASVAPYLRGGRWRRAAEGQTVVDGSWATAQRADGGFDRERMFGATVVQLPAWIAGTALGAVLLPSVTISYHLGLDVVFPGFFALLLVDVLRARPDVLPIAGTAIVISGGGLLVMPPGPALLTGSLAALLALRSVAGQRRRSGPTADRATA